MRHIEKRIGHLEPFDQRKLFASIYKACLVALVPHNRAELLAQAVTDDVIDHVGRYDRVQSNVIADSAAMALANYNPDAAYLYRTHGEGIANV